MVRGATALATFMSNSIFGSIESAGILRARKRYENLLDAERAQRQRAESRS